MSDYRIIIQQMKDLWKIKNIFPIRDIEVAKIYENSIGETTGKFTYENYYDRYNECLTNKSYQIIFQDESIISMYYSFNEDKSLYKYNLSFIPSLSVEIDEDNCDINNIIMDVQDYIRIDYDECGYKKILHEYQHLHYGLYKSGKEDDRKSIRIPIAEKLYPMDFIYLILILIYHIDADSLQILKKYFKESAKLIDIEEQIFHIKYKMI